MVIPLIIGSVIKSIIDQENFNFNLDFSILFVGFFGAFFTGIIACKWMLHIVENFKLKYFFVLLYDNWNYRFKFWIKILLKG